MVGMLNAMVFDGPGQPLRAASLPRPELKPGEVLVGVTLTTLCGSDLHTLRGDRPAPCPSILGHEIIGEVAELPAEPVCDTSGRPLAVGDRVTWSIAASCGSCFFCDRRMPQKCESLVKYGHEPLTGQHGLSGGLAEYCRLVRGTSIVSLPEGLPERVAVSANCATATVVAALGRAGDVAGECVVIHGAGMLGCTAAAMARHRGADSVLVTDLDARRLETARRFGATEVVDVESGAELVGEVIESLTGGRGADVVLELSGSSVAAEQSLGQLRIGGRLVLVGAVHPGPPIAVDAQMVVRRLLTISGVHNYAPVDLEQAVAFLGEVHAEWPFAELVGEVFPLSEADAAFRLAMTSTVQRVGVAPGDSALQSVDTGT